MYFRCILVLGQYIKIYSYSNARSYKEKIRIIENGFVGPHYVYT
jgi:hypothetical protein